jgi:hypothetical protein
MRKYLLLAALTGVFALSACASGSDASGGATGPHAATPWSQDPLYGAAPPERVAVFDNDGTL